MLTRNSMTPKPFVRSLWKSIRLATMAIAIVFPAIFNVQNTSHSGFVRVLEHLIPIGSTTAWASDNDLFTKTHEQAASIIERLFQKALGSVEHGQIRAVRQDLSQIGYEFETNKKVFTRDEKKNYESRLTTLRRSVQQAIDSLVTVNLTIVTKDGPKAGYEFRQYLAIKQGISETELASVDEAITASTLTEDVSRDASSDRLPAETPIGTPATPPKQAGDIAGNKAKAAAMMVKVTALLDEGKTSEAMTVFQIYQIIMERHLARPMYDQLKTLLDIAYAQDQNQRRQAAARVIVIEQFLDHDRIAEAYAELRGARSELQRFLDMEELRSIESRVEQAYADLKKQQALATGVMLTIRTSLTAKETDKAYVAFEKSRSLLERNLSKEVFEGLRQDVSAAYSALQDKKKFSEWCHNDIVSHIKAGRGNAAYIRFVENRTLLKQHLDNNSFTALESAAVSANKDFILRQKKAQSITVRIDSLNGCTNGEEAHILFLKMENTIRRDLADDTRFFEFKDRHTKAYNAFKERKKSALRCSEKITYMIDRREGRKAYALFQQETKLLREHLEPQAFIGLQQNTTRAKTEYEQHYKTARSTTAAIKQLMAQKKIEQAHILYKQAEEELDFFLAEDTAVESLGDNVREAYAVLQERKRWAADMVRQIKRLIEKKQGNQAQQHFTGNRIELTKYIDSKSMASLSGEVAIANRRYLTAQAHAERDAARIRELLALKRIERAYAVFDSVESDLQFYLADSAFSVLKTKVVKLNNALLDNNRDAMQMFETIKNLITANDGDSAYSLFRLKDTFLAKHLNAQKYRSLKEQAIRAKADYTKNCNLAIALAGKLQALVQRGMVETAHGEFDDKRDYLEHYLAPGSFAQLQTAVRVSYKNFLQKRDKARSTVSALKGMLWQNQATAAYAEFGRHMDSFKRFLPEDEYLEIKTKINQAYSSSVRGRREAQTTSARIKQLLGEGNISDAYQTYRDSRSSLELYLSTVEFSNLQTAVTSVYNEQEEKRKQVIDYSKKLEQLVAKNKLWDAYKGFMMNRRALREYLGEQAYADLEKTVVVTYTAARAKAKGMQ